MAESKNQEETAKLKENPLFAASKYILGNMPNVIALILAMNFFFSILYNYAFFVWGLGVEISQTHLSFIDIALTFDVWFSIGLVPYLLFALKRWWIWFIPQNIKDIFCKFLAWLQKILKPNFLKNLLLLSFELSVASALVFGYYYSTKAYPTHTLTLSNAQDQPINVQLLRVLSDVYVVRKEKVISVNKDRDDTKLDPAPYFINRSQVLELQKKPTL